MDLRRQMPWLCLELLFSILCMCCMDKGSSLNLDLMISGNYIMIIIMLMSIYEYMCVYMLCFTGSSRIMIVLC